MKHFRFYSKEDVLSMTRLRRFETKLGERLQVLPGHQPLDEALHQHAAKFVLFGIPEDIGVKANLGLGGADTAWLPFLYQFLNLQSNDFFPGDNVLLLGHFDFGDIKYLIDNNAFNETERVDAYRHAVNLVDEEVEQLVRIITASGKIPVVVGGGHNNAYPLIKGAAKGLFKSGRLPLAQINAINLDAHADFRTSEGRHSGNAFRYASEDGFLGKYCVIGLHENYIPQNVLMDIHNDPFVDYISYEEIFIHERKNFIQAVAHAAALTEDSYTGIELDLDCIELQLSSALTPSGIRPSHARQYLTYSAQDCKVAYLHICEGATQLGDGRKSDHTGKLISYLVSDFIKEASQC